MMKFFNDAENSPGDSQRSVDALPVIRGFQIDSTGLHGSNCKDKGNACNARNHDAEVTSYCEHRRVNTRR